MEPDGTSGCFEDILEGSCIDVYFTLWLGPEEAGVEIDEKGQCHSETIELADIMTRIGRQNSQKLANKLLSFLQKTILTGADIYMILPG